MNKLYNKKGVKEDDEKIYKYLKKIENILKDCEVMELDTNCEESFYMMFPNTYNFLLEVSGGEITITRGSHYLENIYFYAHENYKSIFNEHKHNKKV